jgi:glucosyl-dolichyl phosphate glucuronosyltransferase
LKASVVICTRNRADSLANTLRSFEATEVPQGLQTEIFVVDNGSTDHTAEVVRRHSAAKIPVRYVLESLPGLSRARNAGIAASRGDIILFTDDDVAPERKWIEHIAAPLVRRECEGVIGRIELANEVCRPWMTQQHKVYLAVSGGPDSEPSELIGANMGFHRSVLDRVPEFDPELGAGALGFGEETLFSWQLVGAGFRLKYIPEASVIHHPDPSRLIRSSLLSTSRKHGASTAYLLHHWFHEKLPSPRLRYYYVALKLRLRCVLEPPRALDAEGVAPWEMSYVLEMEKCRHFLIECRRPRNYSKRGLRKRGP